MKEAYIRLNNTSLVVGKKSTEVEITIIYNDVKELLKKIEELDEVVSED